MISNFPCDFFFYPYLILGVCCPVSKHLRTLYMSFCCGQREYSAKSFSCICLIAMHVDYCGNVLFALNCVLFLLGSIIYKYRFESSWSSVQVFYSLRISMFSFIIYRALISNPKCDLFISHLSSLSFYVLYFRLCLGHTFKIFMCF